MEHAYFIRITPREPITLQDVEELLDKLLIKKYFLCIEEATRVHFHACVWTTRSSENLRYQMKANVDGQIYISGKEIEDKVKAISYCMKDGSYVHKEINIHDLLTAKANTFKKVTFDSDIKKLQNSTADLSHRQIVTEIVEIHIRHNRKIYIQHIRALADLLVAKKSQEYKTILINKILGEY